MIDGYGGQLGSTGTAVKVGVVSLVKLGEYLTSKFKLLAIGDSQIDEEVVCWCSVGV